MPDGLTRMMRAPATAAKVHLRNRVQSLVSAGKPLYMIARHVMYTPPRDEKGSPFMPATMTEKMEKRGRARQGAGNSHVIETLPPERKLALSIEEVGAILGVSRSTALQMIGSGALPSFLVDGCRRRLVRRATLETYLAELEARDVAARQESA